MTTVVLVRDPSEYPIPREVVDQLRVSLPVPHNWWPHPNNVRFLRKVIVTGEEPDTDDGWLAFESENYNIWYRTRSST